MKYLCDALLKTDIRGLAEKPVGTACWSHPKACSAVFLFGVFAVIYEIKLKKFSEVTGDAVRFIIRGWEAVHSAFDSAL